MPSLRRISKPLLVALPALLFVAMLAPTLSAVYNAANIIQVERLDDGRMHIVVQYIGNAGEPVQNGDFILDGSVTDPNALRALVIAQINRLNGRLTLQGLISVGPVNLTPISPPATVGSSHYYSAPLPFTPGATPQDVCTLTGSATKTVFVSRASLSSTQTTAGTNAWVLLKRSTANTGGTSAAAGITLADSLAPAATATALTYTVNPTAGTLVGRLFVRHVDSPAPATADIGNALHDVFATVAGPIVLRGTGEVLAWNFNGAALPAGLSVSCGFEWAEQ